MQIQTLLWLQPVQGMVRFDWQQCYRFLQRPDSFYLWGLCTYLLLGSVHQVSVVVLVVWVFWRDLERDWEISFFSTMRKQKTVLVRMDSLRLALARPTLSLVRLITHSCQVRPVFPRPTQISDRAYLYLMASNLLLRLSWTYKLSPHLRHDHAVVFCIVILEVVRRCQWIAVRFEVELRKLQGSDSSLLPLVPGKQRRLGGIPGGGDLSPRIM